MVLYEYCLLHVYLYFVHSKTTNVVVAQCVQIKHIHICMYVHTLSVIQMNIIKRNQQLHMVRSLECSLRFD